MDAQQIFTTAIRHLYDQGSPAEHPNSGGCMYRTPDGKRCAVGVLLSDEVYHPCMERKCSEELVEHHKGNSTITVLQNRLPEWFVTHRNLLDSLQRLHDGISDDMYGRTFADEKERTEYFRSHLLDEARVLAREHNLSMEGVLTPTPTKPKAEPEVLHRNMVKAR